MLKLPYYLLFFFAVSSVSLSFGQNEGDSNQTESHQTVEFYIKNILLGKGVHVSNIKHHGAKGGIGQFKVDSTILGVKHGLILSTGNIDSIFRANRSSGYTSFQRFDYINNGKKKRVRRKRILRTVRKELRKVTRRKATDISVVEFDFVPVNNKLVFNYVFASDEYPEFTGSGFNDGFGFFLSGERIKKSINLAVLPDSVTPISINSINQWDNNHLYRGSESFIKRTVDFIPDLFRKKKVDSLMSYKELKQYIEFDGMTRVLKIEYTVEPFKKYHIMLGITDCGDIAYDSSVFLEAGSFISCRDPNLDYIEKLDSIISNNITFDVDSILGIKMDLETDPVDSGQVIFESLEFSDILFSSDQDSIITRYNGRLDSVTDFMLERKLNVLVVGYTDDKGSVEYNKKLSKRRAENVKRYLISKGIKSANIEIDYKGIDWGQPNELARRVELIIQEEDRTGA